jgi:hypothetical protein
MNIHLSRPGGQREGPFTLDQINQDLAANKYRDTDYWAWYEGLVEWVPLHQVPGVVRNRAPEPSTEPKQDVTAGDTKRLYREEPASEQAAPGETVSESPVSGEAPSEDNVSENALSEEPAIEPTVPEESASEEPEPEGPVSEESGSEDEPVSEQGASAGSASEEPAPEELAVEESGSEAPASEEAVSQDLVPEEPSNTNAEAAEAEGAPPSLAQQLYSGMPFEALEQVLMLASGDGQTASRSQVTAGMLEAVAGEQLDVIREKVPRDAMGGCSFLEKLRGGGSIPEAAWRAAAKLKPEVVRQAREGLYRICVRTYPIETGEMVALFLFYNKQML